MSADDNPPVDEDLLGATPTTPTPHPTNQPQQDTAQQDGIVNSQAQQIRRLEASNRYLQSMLSSIARIMERDFANINLREPPTLQQIHQAVPYGVTQRESLLEIARNWMNNYEYPEHLTTEDRIRESVNRGSRDTLGVRRDPTVLEEVIPPTAGDGNEGVNPPSPSQPLPQQPPPAGFQPFTTPAPQPQPGPSNTFTTRPPSQPLPE